MNTATEALISKSRRAHPVRAVLVAGAGCFVVVVVVASTARSVARLIVFGIVPAHYQSASPSQRAQLKSVKLPTSTEDMSAVMQRYEIRAHPQQNFSRMVINLLKRPRRAACSSRIPDNFIDAVDHDTIAARYFAWEKRITTVCVAFSSNAMEHHHEPSIHSLPTSGPLFLQFLPSVLALVLRAHCSRSVSLAGIFLRAACASIGARLQSRFRFARIGPSACLQARGERRHGMAGRADTSKRGSFRAAFQLKGCTAPRAVMSPQAIHLYGVGPRRERRRRLFGQTRICDRHRQIAA